MASDDEVERIIREALAMLVTSVSTVADALEQEEAGRPERMALHLIGDEATEAHKLLPHDKSCSVRSEPFGPCDCEVKK